MSSGASVGFPRAMAGVQEAWGAAEALPARAGPQVPVQGPACQQQPGESLCPLAARRKERGSQTSCRCSYCFPACGLLT